MNLVCEDEDPCSGLVETTDLFDEVLELTAG